MKIIFKIILAAALLVAVNMILGVVLDTMLMEFQQQSVIGQLEDSNLNHTIMKNTQLSIDSIKILSYTFINAILCALFVYMFKSDVSKLNK